MLNQYLQTTEPLFFLDRLDRFSPLTCKFFSFGANVTTPMTQDETVNTIINGGGDSREALNRRLSTSHIGPGVRNSNSYYNADNNHSGYWESGFVHCIPRSLTFWNLDDDFETVLKEAFEIDPSIGADIIRNYAFDLLESEDKLTQALQNNPDNSFLHWLDRQKQGLPDVPDTASSDYRPEITDAYYDAVDDIIFKPLSHKTELNDAIIQLVGQKGSKDDHYKKTILKNDILRSVFPKNDNADGYIIDGFKSLIPNDAMRGAIYVGNVCEALETHQSGKKLLDLGDDIESSVRVVYGIRNKELENNQYPTIMTKAMASDWVTDGPFTKGHPNYSTTYGNIDDAFDMALHPKSEYPQIGDLQLLQIDCRRQDVEPDVVVNSPKYEELMTLRREMSPEKYRKPTI